MGRVSAEELAELQDPDTWEDDEDPIRPAVKSPRAIVSVAFSREDFEAVADYASQRGMKTSEFIRQATLERMSPDQYAVIVSVSGGVMTSYASVSARRLQVRINAPAPQAYATN